MGLRDSFNRWRLARKGMSSGRKRRTSRDDTLARTIGRSVWVRRALYVMFLGLTGVLLLGSGTEDFDATRGRMVMIGILVALTAVVLLHVHHREIVTRNGQVVLVLGGLVVHLLLLRAVAAVVLSNDLPPEFGLLLIPFALVPMTHAVLMGRGVGAFSAIYVALLGSLMCDPERVGGYLAVSLTAGLVAVHAVDRARKRWRLLRAGFFVGAVVALMGWLLGEVKLATVFQVPQWSALWQIGLATLVAFGVSVVTAMLVSGMLPVLESLFGLTTEISWIEMADLNHRLLRRMQIEAPGTFHHSSVVAVLAESAGEAIGANAAMARVCALFHDVGKLVKPLYFIENQGELGENPHDALTPTMSALVIIAHVKDGVDLALKHKLNRRIIDVIREHHGDSLVYYFHRKAVDQRKAELEKVTKGIADPQDLPKLDEKSFRYPGPRPGSKESGIISLADAVESAVRGLQKPTPAKIRATIDEMVQGRLLEGQLDRCDLTIHDLAVIKECFATTLRSMMHNRIVRPPEEERSNNGTRRPDAGPKSEAGPQTDAGPKSEVRPAATSPRGS